MKINNTVKEKVSSNQVKVGAQFIIQVQAEPRVRIKVKVKDWVRLRSKLIIKARSGMRSKSKVR